MFTVSHLYVVHVCTHNTYTCTQCHFYTLSLSHNKHMYMYMYICKLHFKDILYMYMYTV